jgi:hypothetical protein
MPESIPDQPLEVQTVEELRDGHRRTDDRPRSIGSAPPPRSRTEVQLQARIAELEARVADITRCLEAAEQRAVERVGQADAARLEAERVLAVIASSRSWRMTSLLRGTMERVRRALAA